MLKKIISLFLVLFAVFVTLFYFWGSEIAFDVKDSEIVTFNNTPSDDSNSITIMTYNVGYFSGMTNNLAVERSKELFETNITEFHKLLDQIKPHILALQEVDFKSERSFFIDQFQEMGKSEYFNYGASAINWNKRYVPFPYFSPSTHFGKMLSGQAILSYYPIVSNRRVVLSQPVNASFVYKKFYLDRLAQYVELSIGDRTLTVINVHLEAFDDDTREKQAKELISEIKTNYTDRPYILIGDFNTVPLYTPDKKYVSDKDNNFINEQTLKLLQDSLKIKPAYPDEFALKDLRSTYTYPSDDPQMKIDHIYYTAEYIEPISHHTIQNTLLSDHLPVIFKFRFK